MMPERIAELRALADAATPGPWRVRWFPVDALAGHDCSTCPDCIHHGRRCCGCYDGACCREGKS